MPATGAQLLPQTCRLIQALIEDTTLSSINIATRVGVTKRTINRIRQSFNLFN